MSNQAKKSRHLSIGEFLDVLQKEYFMCKIRKKIYPSPSDKRFYERVMHQKRETILDISERNHLPSIFEDEGEYKRYEKKVFPFIGLPLFDLTEQDIQFYYLENTEVRVNDGDVVIGIGRIESVDLDHGVVYVKLKNKKNSQPFSVKYVTRIL